MKPKIPVVRVPSDDCAIQVGMVIQDGVITDQGEAYYIHKGEWVEVLPVRSMREYLALAKLAGASNDQTGQLATSLDDLCDELAHRVVDWNWTDIMGEELDQPWKRPDVIQRLSNGEILWLVTAAGGETGAQRGNVSTPSPDTSTTAPAKSRRQTRA